jgi:C-terminal processing protease CtpA/Prc
MGDKTAGAVMTSRYFDMELGVGTTLYCGATITISNMIMPDGKSLEKVGVIPDELILPTGQDLANGRDPVLAEAVKKFGIDLSPEKAGTFFPIEWDQIN